MSAETAPRSVEETSINISRRDVFKSLVELAKEPTSFFGLSTGTQIASLTGLSLLIEDKNNVRRLATNPRDPKYIELPHTFVYGKQVGIVGVSHIPKTFEANRENIEERVYGSPFTILEYFEDGARSIALPTTNFTEMKIRGYNDLVDMFFGQIGRLCAEKGRDILVVNPETAMSQYLESYYMFGLSGALVLSDIGYLHGKIKSEPVTRRHFLKLLGYVVTGFTWLSWLGSTRELRNTLGDDLSLNTQTSELERADVLGMSLIDWRDVNSAIGISAAMKHYADEITVNQVIPVFQGAGHDGTAEYLKNLQTARNKSELYALRNLTGKNTVKRYTYDKNSNSWKLKEEIPY